jgi:NAD(P)-dependent dehydrogenase (short-subunit alcohol dehydrogenase family)
LLRSKEDIVPESKIAVITGGSRGLGRNSVIHLAQKGVGVVFTYQSSKAEAETIAREIDAAGGKAVALPLDTGNVADFPEFAGRLRKVLTNIWNRDTFDYLVNNAGVSVMAKIGETKEEDFDRLVNIHLKGVFFLTQTLLPSMADGGRIVNLSSGLARFCTPGFSAYAMMKGGIEVFTRYLAKELGSRGITANTVAPGAIATDFGGGMVRDNPAFNKAVASGTALGRAGIPDDIGPMIASLLSDDNRWVNAQRIEVSGGAAL